LVALSSVIWVIGASGIECGSRALFIASDDRIESRMANQKLHHEYISSSNKELKVGRLNANERLGQRMNEFGNLAISMRCATTAQNESNHCIDIRDGI
jgi:hypothetical protein